MRFVRYAAYRERWQAARTQVALAHVLIDAAHWCGGANSRSLREDHRSAQDRLKKLTDRP